MSERSVGLLLEDICDAIEKIGRYIEGMTKSDFLDDEKTGDAVVRNLEIIGEAASRLPQGFRQEHSEIEWKKIVGLRHRIVHEYFGVDFEIVWNIITDILPFFQCSVQQIRASEDDSQTGRH